MKFQTMFLMANIRDLPKKKIKSMFQIYHLVWLLQRSRKNCSSIRNSKLAENKMLKNDNDKFFFLSIILGRIRRTFPCLWSRNCRSLFEIFPARSNYFYDFICCLTGSFTSSRVSIRWQLDQSLFCFCEFSNKKEKFEFYFVFFSEANNISRIESRRIFTTT